MIVGPELAAWIGDGERQRQTQSGIDSLAREWRLGPVHQRFTAAMADLPAESSSAVSTAVTALFADDVWVERLIDTLTSALRDDPYFEPPFSSVSSEIHSGILVYEDRHVSIAAGVTTAEALAAKKDVERQAISINFTGFVSVLKFVSAGDAYLSFWEAPVITGGFTAREAGQCRRTGGRQIRDGEILVCDGRFQSYVIEHARSNMVIVQATVKADQAPLLVEYDATSHEYVGCSATDDSSSRIQMITTLLRKLGRVDAFAVIASFLDHADFFVRWHVMRELLGIDPQAALRHLQRMAVADPHPENRAAAAKVLAMLPDLQTKKAA
jgi:hypothetical protein